MIEAKYKQSNEVSMHRVFRVFLGNTSVFNKTGGGSKITVRHGRSTSFAGCALCVDRDCHSVRNIFNGSAYTVSLFETMLI